MEPYELIIHLRTALNHYTIIMKKALQLFLLLSIFLAADVSAQVKSDYDKNTDFSKFKTYTFAGWQQDSDKQLNDFDKKRILDALQSEFEKRGMTLVKEGGDATITLYLVLNEKTSTTAYTDYTGGYGYGPRWGWGMGPGGGMGSSTTTYSQSDYLEGTMVIDIYDSNGRKMIWQGVLTSIVNDNPQKREKTIPKKIAKLMRKYPVEIQR